MADYLRQSPLAHLGLEGRAESSRGSAGVALAERPFQGIVDLRGRSDEIGPAFEKIFGFALPLEPNSVGGKGRTSAFWLGPDEWWIVSQSDNSRVADKLLKGLSGHVAAVTEIGESRTCIRVAGPRARDLIAKGCPLDLHPRVFGPGACAQSLLAKAGVMLHMVSGDRARGGPSYDLYVVRSFADYLWRWLEDAAQEYGVAVVRS